MQGAQAMQEGCTSGKLLATLNTDDWKEKWEQSQPSSSLCGFIIEAEKGRKETIAQGDGEKKEGKKWRGRYGQVHTVPVVHKQNGMPQSNCNFQRCLPIGIESGISGNC